MDIPDKMEIKDFKPITVESKKEISEFLNSSKSISCELCFGNLFAWSKVENTEYYVNHDENALCLRNNVHNNDINYYFPIFKEFKSTENKIGCVKNFIDFHKKYYDTRFKFTNLLTEQAEFLRNNFNNFVITQNKDHSEYIYEAESLRTFSGKKLHGKKNHLNKFYSLYRDSFKYENIDDSNIEECLKLSWKWRKLNRYYLNDSMLEELHIVGEFIKNYDKLNLIGGCIKIGGEIKAFTIGEAAYDKSDTVIIHVEKADYEEVEGIYPAICSMFLSAHPEFNFVNREDDLGDEGLRQSKLSYRPLYLLDRYEAFEKEETIEI
ncbi:MAG: phosphatidylglycerol lysyltransferase domain-containing protein [Oscillospiraceae bacterium]|nr:phosphatidylglycerol lysyltransferase domain-containing protein [Oscillospiraceae bacterium]